MWMLIVLLILVVVLAHYVKTYLELRATGCEVISVGIPVFYCLPSFLYRIYRGTLFDDIVEVLEDAPHHCVARKRTWTAPPMIISANPMINKYVLERPDEFIKVVFLFLTDSLPSSLSLFF